MTAKTVVVCPGCGTEAIRFGFGLCRACWKKNARVVALTPSAMESFLTRIDMNGDGCWEWRGGKMGNGYGCGPADRYPHRLMAELIYGDAADGKVVCHTCDNRTCVRPSHLWLGTQADNLRDMMAKGRGVWPPPRVGEQANAAKLTADQVRQIRRRFRAGESLASITRSYNVSHTTISKAAKGLTWRHLVTE